MILLNTVIDTLELSTYRWIIDRSEKIINCKTNIYINTYKQLYTTIVIDFLDWFGHVSLQRWFPNILHDAHVTRSNIFVGHSTSNQSTPWKPPALQAKN